MYNYGKGVRTMIDRLEYDIEKRAERAENLSFCKGIKVLKIKDTIASMLKVIGKNEIFEQYTVHDISHINEMLKIAEWLIPDSTKSIMTDSEWLMLTLAIYFHDLGMVVSKKEFEQRESNSLFVEFKQSALENATPEYKKFVEDEKYLYQEFVRANHAFRIKEWLENKGENKYGAANEQCEILNADLSPLFEKFRCDLGMICESHHKDDIEDFEKYKIKSRYGSDDQEIVNLNYIALILRCTDLLHITNDRTPSIERKLLDVSNPVSILEWEKQQAVKAITAQSKRDGDGNIDETIVKDTIEITAYFSGSETADAYFGLSSYLQYVKKELSVCNKIANKAKKQEGSKYDFPWRYIDEHNITTEGFEAKKLEFTIEQDNILKLLVGHTLYNDSSVVVRELTQNAIDAIKLQRILEKGKKKGSYKGKITIEWDSTNRTLSFCDNGTGMTISDIENYLLKVGASKYRQKQFQETYKEFNPISRFGIGLLTCFMVANDVDIETNSTDAEEVSFLCLRNVNGKYLLKKKPKSQACQYIKDHGTIIKLHIRPDVDMSDLESNLKKWIVLSEIPIELVIDEYKTQIAYTTLKDALVGFLEENNYNVDGTNIKVEEKTIGNVSVACALKYNKYISDWSFIPVSRIDDNNKSIPVGTCVEGVRVEFETPGYRNANIFSLANITGSKFQTNVARTALEYDANNEALRSIYDCYRLFVEDQISELQKNNYSKSWALEEGHYLMSPLLESSYSTDKLEPIDRELLIKSLSELKCLFVEKNGDRSNLSITDVQNLEQFDILDYEMINVIESLFKEIPSDITVSNMIQSILGKDINLGNNHIITNFNKYNLLHNQVMQNKQVSKIDVDIPKRKIQLTYTNSNSIWNTYNIRNEFRQYYRSNKQLNIPIEDFVIDGLVSEAGIKSIGGIYLNSNSDLCKYLKKVISIFESDKTKENNILLDIFLEQVFNTNFLEYSIEEKDSDYFVRRITQGRNSRFDDTIASKMWEKIDLDEFKKEILLKKHVLFSLDNWIRTSDSFG